MIIAWCNVPKAYGSWFMYLCVYLYVCNSDFLKVAKPSASCSERIAWQYLLQLVACFRLLNCSQQIFLTLQLISTTDTAAGSHTKQ